MRRVPRRLDHLRAEAAASLCGLQQRRDSVRPSNATRRELIGSAHAGQKPSSACVETPKHTHMVCDDLRAARGRMARRAALPATCDLTNHVTGRLKATVWFAFPHRTKEQDFGPTPSQGLPPLTKPRRLGRGKSCYRDGVHEGPFERYLSRSPAIVA
jgi:hypothetical protein